MATEDDKSYDDAAVRSIARMWGTMYQELRAKGATHKSARRIVVEYIRNTLKPN